ncbi:hypothetical protein BG011_005674 [Mortierella polycephala]|uniref:ATPase inhibitor, mitochondrial n=1 Tax=Mortierella polycephala TaxID=41804 RepID=A0A9P6PY30_9FUNG|nr:hypothetical protein BG011_005674 [Mortierella polycephala]
MLRTTTTAAVRALKPVQASAIACRNYSSGSFSQKEKAEEAKYIRAKEQETIKKLQEELAKKDKELQELKQGKN